MSRTIAVLTLVVGSAAAFGQPGTKSQIDLKVRLFGSADPWTDTLAISNPFGVAAEVEVGCFYYRDDGVGLATVVHNIVGSPYSSANRDLASIIDNTTGSTQHPDGRIGTGTTGFNNGGQQQAVYHPGFGDIDFNRFRIAASGNPLDLPAGGISIKQNTPAALGTNFITADGVLAYHFKLSLADYGAHDRTVTIDAPKDKINSFRVYGATTDFPLLNLLPSDPATIHATWVPAPATLALLGPVACLKSRRRR